MSANKGGAFRPLVIIILIAAVAVVAVSFVFVRPYSMKYRDSMETLDGLRVAGGEAFNSIRTGNTPPAEIMEALRALRADADAVVAKNEKAAPPAVFMPLWKNLLHEWRAVNETGAEVTGLLFSLETAAHFMSFGLINTGELDHAAEHMKTAELLNSEISESISEFNSGEFAGDPAPPGWKAPEGAQYVFIILIDALRADHVGAYGYAKDTTPFINSLAGEGLVFENAVAQCSSTDTSVASLFTSLYPRTHKMFASVDWLYEASLIGRFRDAGFVTGGFSSNMWVSPEYHYDEGFDHFELHQRNRAMIMVDSATRWIEKHRGGRDKIFAYVHLFEPHDIYLAPPPFYDMFDKGARHRFLAFTLRQTLEKKARCGFDPYAENWDDPGAVVECLNAVPGISNLGLKDIDNMIARYDGEIRYADSQVERFFDYLKKSGMLEESLVVITADHGESFLDHNQFQHGQVLYDNEIHVPLIFWRGGENFGGVRVSHQVEIVDVLPTIFGLTGIDIPSGLHGTDALEDSFNDSPDMAYSTTWNYHELSTDRRFPSMSARGPRYKLIETPGAGRTELYDLQEDPAELVNVCADHPDICSEMRKDVLRWDKETDKAPPRPVDSGMDEKKLKQLKDMGYIN